MKKILLLFWCLLTGWLGINAQPQCQVRLLDENDGLPHSHVTQLLQDADGLMWFSTWNGLCRYDGYEFQTFKPMAGDGCHIPTDRIRDIALRADGNILCRVDDNYYLFDTHTSTFRDIPPNDIPTVADINALRQSRSLTSHSNFEWTDEFGTIWTLDHEGHLAYHTASAPTSTAIVPNLPIHGPSFALADRQGCLWVLGKEGIYQVVPHFNYAQWLPQQQPAQIKAFFADSHGRYWVTTREDATVRLYDLKDDHLLGYLGRDGALHASYTSFGSPVYCLYESPDGTIWLGTKPDGIYRLRETAAGHFFIDHLTDLPCRNVYAIRQDRYGRLWAGTLDGGLCYCKEPQAANPTFIVPKGYPTDGSSQRVRYLHITRGDVLLAATTDGLLVTKLEKDADKMRFHRHFREPDRATSLSSSAIMDILEDSHGRLFVSTESGGVNRIEDKDLLGDHLTFTHLNTKSHHLLNDVAMSLTLLKDNAMMVVGNYLVSIIDSTGHTRTLDSRHLGINSHFSDAHPLHLGADRWLIGLDDGALLLPAAQMNRKTFAPRVVITGAFVQGGSDNRATQHTDTLTLQPGERNVTVHFAAIDYKAEGRINYAFRLVNDDNNNPWNYIGHNRSATLIDLVPNTYVLEVRSTDADGQWLDNVRRLTIVVLPTFWESGIGRSLIALLILSLLAAVASTILYIRRIRRQQHETLEAYLALLNDQQEPPTQQTVATVAKPTNINPEDDAMIKRVMAFIEENIGNSDVNIGDMATAAATSRSGLQRKLKQAMGITPQDLLREARIKHACQLLRQTDKTVAEVAYACGFSDPKYFSRCFKTSTGQSPTAFKSGGE